MLAILVCGWHLGSQNTFERVGTALRDAAEALKVKDRVIVAWDDEAELPGDISVIPVWKFLLGQ